MQNLANQLVAAAASNEISYFQHAAADLTSAYSKLQPVVAAAHLITAAAAQQQHSENVGSGQANPNAASTKEILLTHFNAALKERPNLVALEQQQQQHQVHGSSSGGGGGGRSGGHHSSASSASSSSGNGHGEVVVVEETVRKREMRLLKNR